MAPLFIDTFFKPELIVRYLPDILKGMVVTIEIARARRRRRISARPCARPHPQPALAARHALIVVFVDIARHCRRRAHPHRLLRLA